MTACLEYQGDVYGRVLDELLERLRELFKLFRQEGLTLQKAGVHEIWIGYNQNSAGEKLCCPDINVIWQE